jgi:hypothetical protein
LVKTHTHGTDRRPIRGVGGTDCVARQHPERRHKQRDDDPYPHGPRRDPERGGMIASLTNLKRCNQSFAVSPSPAFTHEETNASLTLGLRL